MGASGSTSRSKASIDTSNTVNALTETIMNCTGNVQSTEDVTVSGSGNAVDVVQVTYLKLSSNCVQGVENVSDLQTKIASALANSSTAQGTSVLSALGGSKSDAETSIKNAVTQNITTKTVTNMINNANAAQKVVVSGNNNAVRVNQSTTEAVVQNAAQNLINSVISKVGIESTADAKASAVTTDLITDVANSIGKTITDGLGIAVTGVAVMWGMAIIGIVLFVWVLGPGVIGALLGNDSDSKPQQNYGDQNVYDDQQNYDDQMGDDQMGDDQMGDGQMGDGQMGDDQMGDGQMGDGQPGYDDNQTGYNN